MVRGGNLLKSNRVVQCVLLAAAMSATPALAVDSSGCIRPPEAAAAIRIASVVQECYEDPVAINDPTVTEGTGATTTITFEVTRGALDRPVTIHYRTFNQTATAPQDFQEVSGTLNFGPSSTSATKTIQVTVVADAAFEGDETFVMRLDGTSGAVIPDFRGIGTIRNDDPVPPQAAPAPVAPAPAPIPPPPGTAPPARPKAAASPLPRSVDPPPQPAPAELPVSPEPSATAPTPEASASPVSQSSQPTQRGGVDPLVAIGLVLLALAGMGGWAFLRFGRKP